jgi:hypothetical protein
LFKSGFFPDVVTFKYPVLSVIALVALVGCGLLQWKLCIDPKKADHRFRQYYLAFALIAAVIVIDMVEIFFKGSNEQIVRDVFGCVVLGIVGMAVAAGVWYLQAKKGKSDE